MGLFDAMRGISNVQQQSSMVKNARKQIMDIRDRLRNTPQYSEIFYQIIGDPKHPPMNIAINYAEGSFWSIGWDERTNNYEPYSTVKMQDPNIAYIESCAIFLLIQESYPNVYDFPNRTTTQIAEYIPVELNMKKNFIGKAIVPAALPPIIKTEQTSSSIAVKQPHTDEADSKRPKFCSECGGSLSATSKFCPSCGTRID